MRQSCNSYHKDPALFQAVNHSSDGWKNYKIIRSIFKYNLFVECRVSQKQIRFSSICVSGEIVLKRTHCLLLSGNQEVPGSLGTTVKHQ